MIGALKTGFASKTLKRSWAVGGAVADDPSFSVFLRIDALEALRDRRQRERDRVFSFARSLADNPFQDSDYREHDSQRRPRDIKIVGRLAVVYNVDHAEQEIRILDVRLVDD